MITNMEKDYGHFQMDKLNKGFLNKEDAFDGLMKKIIV